VITQCCFRRRHDAFRCRGRRVVNSAHKEDINVKTRLLLIACLLVLMSTLVMKASHPVAAQEIAPPLGLIGADCGDEPCDAVVRGLLAFLDGRLDGLDGNGRSCADCHMPTDSFQLSPASAEKRFTLLQLRRRGNPDADDPLFRPIDADDFRTNGDTASDYSNLRENGLVRVEMRLPPNIRLIDPTTNLPSSETFVDVWRATPTVNDVALTGPDTANPWPRGPNQTGGYQLDGRFGTLQEQALGALNAHAQIRNAPLQQRLDDLTSFERVLFTNHRVRALSEAIDAGSLPLPDPDPPLNALELQGKAVFERACTQCHGGPSLSNAQLPVMRFHDISSQCPRPVDTALEPRFAFAPCPPRLARNARTYEITLANGTKTRRTSSDPGRALLTGFVGGPAPQDDWNKLDMNGLRGIRHTAPYFHNNSAATLEDVVDHYVEFFKRVRVNTAPNVPPVLSTNGIDFDRPPAPEDRAALLAYLRKL
jgi:cytochrome c peroxidase